MGSSPRRRRRRAAGDEAYTPVADINGVERTAADLGPYALSSGIYEKTGLSIS